MHTYMYKNSVQKHIKRNSRPAHYNGVMVGGVNQQFIKADARQQAIQCPYNTQSIRTQFNILKGLEITSHTATGQLTWRKHYIQTA